MYVCLNCVIELVCNWFGLVSESVPNRCAVFFFCRCWSLDAPTYTRTLANRKKRYCVHIVCRDMFTSRPPTSPAGPHTFLLTRPRTLHCRHTNKYVCMCLCACILSIIFYVHLFTVLDSEICTAGSDRQGTELTFSQIANEYIFFSCDRCRTLWHTHARVPLAPLSLAAISTSGPHRHTVRYMQAYIYAWIHASTGTYAYICM